MIGLIDQPRRGVSLLLGPLQGTDGMAALQRVTGVASSTFSVRGIGGEGLRDQVRCMSDVSTFGSEWRYLTRKCFWLI
jgi:hypothetical protein